MDRIALIECFFDLLLFLACGFALWRGTMVERFGASIAIVATALTAVAVWVSRSLELPGRYGYVGADTLTLIAFAVLMLRSRSFWPIWASGFQLAAVSTDVASICWPTLKLPLWLLSGIWAYLITGAIVAGALRAYRLRRQGLLLAGERAQGR